MAICIGVPSQVLRNSGYALYDEFSVNRAEGSQRDKTSRAYATPLMS